MITVCAWCDRYLGPEGSAVTHGICPACTARQHWRDSPVLVIARHREAMAPVLRHLLHGSPEVRIVIERRRDERRRSEEPAPSRGDRRTGRDRRRRRADLVLV